MKQTFLNQEDMLETFRGIFTDYAEENYPAYCAEDLIEDYSYLVTEQTMNDMDKYVHFKDHNITGNFCNIEYNYEWEHEGQHFEDLVKRVDEGLLTDEELKDLQEWTADWYFKAFGTFGLTYNFSSVLSDDEYEFLKYNCDVEQFFNYKKNDCECRKQSWEDYEAQWAVESYEDIHDDYEEDSEYIKYLKEHDLYQFSSMNVKEKEALCG